MHKGTGDIVSQEAIDKLEDPYERDKYTPLSKAEHKHVEPLNRHERRAALVKMRREAKEQQKLAKAKLAKLLQKVDAVKPQEVVPETHDDQC